MDFSKPLLLKGLGGLAAVGTIGGGIVYGRDMLLRNQDEKDKARKEVNDKLETLGLKEDCRLKEEEDPFTISKECDLDEGKLKVIKFSNKGEGELTVKGWPSEGGLKLKVERKSKEENISFSFTGLTEGSDIKIFGDKSKGKIILKSSTPEQKFKEKDGKLTKDSSGVDADLKAKLEEFNKQLGTVNAPIECRFDEAETEDSVVCGVTQEGLKGLKFSGLGEGDLTVKGEVPADLKLKVEKDAEKAMSLSFTGLSGDLTIYGDSTKGKIILKSTPESKFKVEDGKLTKKNRSPEIEKLNEQLVKVNAPIECRFDEAESEASIECGVTEGELKKMKFSNKEGDGDLKIVGWPASGAENIKLKVEKDAQNAMSLSFTGLTAGSDIKLFGDKTKGKIIIKNADGGNKKFKVQDDKLTKDSSGVDPSLKSKLEDFNKQLEKVNAPLECRFDEAETEASVECGVTPDDLKTMIFKNGQGNLTYKDGEGFTGMKLEVQFRDQAVDSKDSKVLTFKGYDKTVKLSNGNNEEVVSFVKGTSPEFVIHDSYLIKNWESEDFENLLGTDCTIPKEVTQADCKFDDKNGEENKKIKVGKGTGDEFEELEVSKSNNKFRLHKDIEDYNQGFKFVYSGERISGGDGSPTLEKNGEYEFRWKSEEGKTRTIYLVKKGK